MDLTVVVDGGGSGCRLAAYDAQGTLCATATDGPASLSLGEEQAWLHIRSGIQNLAKTLGLDSEWLPSRLCLGLAGSLQDARRLHFLSLIPANIQTKLVTDGHAQLLGATAGQPGICLAVGTGSVMHWCDEAGNFDMAGGWGFPIGDEASGAWLGRQLINAYLWHRDDKRSDSHPSKLFNTLENRIGTDVADVQVWSTSTRSTELASLAPMIVAAAEQSDPLANSLLDRGTEFCERLINLAPVTLPIYVVGGLAETYRLRLSPSISVRCKAPLGDALGGLYRLSCS